MSPNTKVAQPMIGRPPEPVGQPPHRHDAQDQEAAGDTRHEGDRAGADVKRRLDVGRQDGQPRALQVVEGDDDGEDDEGREPRGAQTLA